MTGALRCPTDKSTCQSDWGVCVCNRGWYGPYCTLNGKLTSQLQPIDCLILEQHTMLIKAPLLCVLVCVQLFNGDAYAHLFLLTCQIQICDFIAGLHVLGLELFCDSEGGLFRRTIERGKK